MARSQDWEVPSGGKDVGQVKTDALLAGMENYTTALDNSLGIDPGEVKTHKVTNMTDHRTWVPTTKNWKLPKHPLTGEWMNKLVHACNNTTQLLNEVTDTYTSTRINLKNITLNKSRHNTIHIGWLHLHRMLQQAKQTDRLWQTWWGEKAGKLTDKGCGKLSGDENVLYFDGGGSNKGKYVCQSSINYTLKIGLFHFM